MEFFVSVEGKPMRPDIEGLIELDGDTLWKALCRTLYAIDAHIDDECERGDGQDKIYKVVYTITTSESIKTASKWMSASEIYEVYDEQCGRERFFQLLKYGENPLITAY